MRAILLFVVLAVAAAAVETQSPRPLAIVGVSVIDPQAGAAIAGTTVVVRDGRIGCKLRYTPHS